jgi:hypothetical protein
MVFVYVAIPRDIDRLCVVEAASWDEAKDKAREATGDREVDLWFHSIKKEPKPKPAAVPRPAPLTFVRCKLCNRPITRLSEGRWEHVERRGIKHAAVPPEENCAEPEKDGAAEAHQGQSGDHETQRRADGH